MRNSTYLETLETIFANIAACYFNVSPWFLLRLFLVFYYLWFDFHEYEGTLVLSRVWHPSCEG